MEGAKIITGSRTRALRPGELESLAVWLWCSTRSAQPVFGEFADADDEDGPEVEETGHGREDFAEAKREFLALPEWKQDVFRRMAHANTVILYQLLGDRVLPLTSGEPT